MGALVHRRLTRRLLALALGAALAHLLRAVAAAQQATTEVGGGVSSFGAGDWAGLLIRLGLVLAVIWGAVALMRWYVRRAQGGGSGRGQVLEVIETHALGPNRTLHLVRLGDRAVLVGATPERITSLLTVDDAEEVRRLSERPEPESPRGFAASLGAVASMASAARAPRAERTSGDAPRVSPLAAMRASLAAFRSMLQPTLTTPRRAEPEARPAPRTPERPSTRRLDGARELLGRVQTARPMTEATPSPRAGLFERTLAAAELAGQRDAAELTASRALRARDGYAASTAPGEAAPTRADRIAEIQRAIADAQRDAS